MESLGVLKEQQNDLVDYKIEAEITTDGTSGVTTGANTAFTKVASTSPPYEASGGKITSITGKFTFNGKITNKKKVESDSNVKTL